MESELHDRSFRRSSLVYRMELPASDDLSGSLTPSHGFGPFSFDEVMGLMVDTIQANDATRFFFQSNAALESFLFD